MTTAKTTKTEMPDELNPAFIFSTTHDDLLLRVANGGISAQGLARQQMANRGLGRKGEWVGFDKAAAIWSIAPPAAKPAAKPAATPGPTGCRCGRTRPWGYTCGSCGVTINEAWVTKVQGENEAKAYKALHDAAPEMLTALKTILTITAKAEDSPALGAIEKLAAHVVAKAGR